MAYEVPAQDLTVDLTQMATWPASHVIMTKVQLRTA
jgi:hypothetical protein